MTAHHIRQRLAAQRLADEIAAAQAATATDESQPVVVFVGPNDAPPAGIDSMKPRAISEAAEAQELHVMINGLFQELNKYGFDVPETRLVAKGYLQLCDAVGYLPEGEVFAEAYADEVRDQRRDDDPLAGLGLRAGDLEAVRDQIMGIVRPVQREHYRAMFMAAVIQGSYAAGNVKRNKFEMIDDAQEVADLTLERMGL